MIVPLIIPMQPYEQHNQELNQQQHPKYGRSIVVCGENCLLGPHYYVFLPTCLLLTALYAALYINVMDSLIGAWKLIVPVSISLNIISYLVVGFSNPGIVVRDQNVPLSDYPYMCTRCNVEKPHGAIHCGDCDSCISEHDHHCPWVGKCVGGANKAKFCTFLAFMFAALIVFFAATVHSQMSSH